MLGENPYCLRLLRLYILRVALIWFICPPQLGATPNLDEKEDNDDETDDADDEECVSIDFRARIPKPFEALKFTLTNPSWRKTMFLENGIRSSFALIWARF